MELQVCVSTIETRDGSRLNVRFIMPEDRERLIRFFFALTPETRRRRFHIDMEHVDPRVVHARARDYVNVDNTRQAGAVLALDAEGEIVGVARLARIEESAAAEAAIVVRDDYQGRGVGGSLLRRLVELARRMEIGVMVAEIESDNGAALRVFRALGLPTKTSFDHGTTVLHISLGE